MPPKPKNICAVASCLCLALCGCASPKITNVSFSDPKAVSERYGAGNACQARVQSRNWCEEQGLAYYWDQAASRAVANNLSDSDHAPNLVMPTGGSVQSIGRDVAKQLPASPQSSVRRSDGHLSVPLATEGGTLVVPVLINDALTLKFVLDSGAADVSIPADVAMTLVRTGTLTSADFLGERTYVLADGTKVPSQVFQIRSLKVGGAELKNVRASISSAKGSLLLGQSFLSRFSTWSIDNLRQVLVLN